MGRSEIGPVSLSISGRFVRRGFQLFALVVTGVLVALVVGFYAENRSNPLVPSGRWLGWVGYTVLLAVFVTRDHRQHWNRVWFWLTLGGLFGVHTGGYALAFQAIDVWRGIWFLPISIAEYPVFLLALRWLGYEDDALMTNRRASRRR